MDNQKEEEAPQPGGSQEGAVESAPSLSGPSRLGLQNTFDRSFFCPMQLFGCFRNMLRVARDIEGWG